MLIRFGFREGVAGSSTWSDTETIYKKLTIGALDDYLK